MNWSGSCTGRTCTIWASSEIGARMIEPLEILSRAVPVVRHHHERPDGTGYPDGLEGEEIPLAARIVAAVDAYDVMLRRRHYRPQRYRPKSSPTEALQESGAKRDASSMCGWSRRWGGCWEIRRHHRLTPRKLISFLFSFLLGTLCVA